MKEIYKVEMQKSDKVSGLHPRNKHKGNYNFSKLIILVPDLSSYVFINKYNVETLDFSDQRAVKLLNKALLKQYYNLNYWDIPNNYLTPPIPGRADYIHNIADFLGRTSGNSKQSIPKGKNIRVLDVGSGANCIYPIIGQMEYGWTFVGSETDDAAINSANQIIQSNKGLKTAIEIRKQSSNNIFKNIIYEDDIFELSMCNPPFHSSKEEALKANKRKLKGIGSKQISNFNFGGQSNELWCKGGEKSFILKMIDESKEFRNKCLWFTTLVSKESNLRTFNQALKSVGTVTYNTIEMQHANKKTRILYWSFLNDDQRMKWMKIKNLR